MKRFFIFISSMLLSLTVFLIPWGFCFYPKEEALAIEEAVIIPKEKEALCLIEDNKTPVIFLHIRLNLNNAEITCLSPNLLAKDTDGSLSLADITSNGGLKYALKALNRSFGFDLTHYFSLSLSSLKELMTGFGSCDFTLPSPVLSNSGEVLFKEGRCLLNSEKAEVILKEGANLTVDERISLFLKITAEIINQRGQLSEKEKESFFNILANERDNNLSVTDFINFKNYRLFDEGFKFTVR